MKQFQNPVTDFWCNVLLFFFCFILNFCWFWNSSFPAYFFSNLCLYGISPYRDAAQSYGRTPILHDLWDSGYNFTVFRYGCEHRIAARKWLPYIFFFHLFCPLIIFLFFLHLFNHVRGFFKHKAGLKTKKAICYDLQVFVLWGIWLQTAKKSVFYRLLKSHSSVMCLWNGIISIQFGMLRQ